MCEAQLQTLPSRRRRGSLARKAATRLSRAVGDLLINEESATRPGLLQRLDPRVKLITMVLFAVTASFVRSLTVLLVLHLLTLGLAAASRVSARSVAGRVWFSGGLLALLIALPSTTSFITPGHVVLSLGPLHITQPGLLGAATLVLRVVASTGVALLMMLTTRFADTLHALSALGMPDIVTATLAMTQQQIVSLLRTVEQQHLARESRTLGSFRAAEERAWVVGRMAHVTRKSLKMADDVYDAMLARGYAGTVRSLTRLRAGRRDAVWLAVSVACCALLLVADGKAPLR